ncbi:MAG TPA: methyltransferase domain-containing protein [Thermoanaerobaculia bacterium]
MRKFIRALIVLHRAFHSRDIRTRLHALVRFFTCPFLRVVRLVPAGARVLDIGAGHGVFSVLAADRGARVVAVEPDLRKVPWEGYQVAGLRGRGNPVTSQLRNHYVVGFDDVVRGTFDVVAIVDVLYKLPVEQWDPLLARALERLAAGGMLIVKEHDPTAKIKNAWNRWQEALATKLGLTLGESFSYETPAEFTARLQRLGFKDVEAKRIDFGYPHPHILYVSRPS